MIEKSPKKKNWRKSWLLLSKNIVHKRSRSESGENLTKRQKLDDAEYERNHCQSDKPIVIDTDTESENDLEVMEPKSPTDPPVKEFMPKNQEVEKSIVVPVAEIGNPLPAIKVAPESFKQVTENLAVVRSGFFYQKTVYKGINELEFEIRKSRIFTFTCAWCNVVHTYQYTDDLERDLANQNAANSFITEHTKCTCQLLAKVTITITMASGFCLKEKLLTIFLNVLFFKHEKCKLLAPKAQSAWSFELSRITA